MVQSRRYWVEYGVLQSATTNTSAEPEDETEQFLKSSVRLTTGELGTEIKWKVISLCASSLFAVCDWVTSLTGPFVLRFFASGWSEEFHDAAKEAASRIIEIIARGDRHFTCRLKNCISGETNAADYAVECLFKDTSQQFHVESVGPRSAIGRVFGTFLSSFPCKSSGSYSEIVSRAYSSVLKSGKPRFDHVLAAMRMPDDEAFWVPYHRLLLPNRNLPQKPSVLVVSEINGVNIKLI